MSNGFLSPKKAVNSANKPPLRVFLTRAQPGSAKKPLMGWLVATLLRAWARGSSKGCSPQPGVSEPPPSRLCTAHPLVCATVAHTCRSAMVCKGRARFILPKKHPGTC